MVCSMLVGPAIANFNKQKKNAQNILLFEDEQSPQTTQNQPARRVSERARERANKRRRVTCSLESAHNRTRSVRCYSFYIFCFIYCIFPV